MYSLAAHLPAAPPAPPPALVGSRLIASSPAGPRAVDLVVLGASAGGPPAIEQVLRDLGPDLTVPVVIAQHMPAAFTRAFAERLDSCLPQRVRQAGHHEGLEPGMVYIAPGGLHLLIECHGGELRTVLSTVPESAPHHPSVDHLFISAGVATRGRLVAVLLTGMGCDGAAAMVELAGAGVHTIAQDRATSAIFGMPRAAIVAGGASEVLPLEKIGPRLLQLLPLAGSDAPVGGAQARTLTA
jgi:two-component system chemotaxis response regulator CheB